MIKYDYSASSSRGGPSSSTMSFADERNFIAPENLIPDEILNPTSTKQKPRRYDNEEFIDDMIASMAPSKKRKLSSPQSSSRPKMIHTEKSRVSDSKKKGKSMVVKQPIRVSARFARSQMAYSKVESEDDSVSEDEYANELVIKKEVTQHDIVQDLTEILYSPARRAIAEEMEHSEEEFSDVEPGRRPRRNVKSRYSAQTLKREHQIEARNKQRTTSESKAKKVIKEEVMDEYRCEICGYLFSCRQQLLLHVPIHI